MLPNMFAADFGDQITRFAALVDTKNNQFVVLVERINGAVFFYLGDVSGFLWDGVSMFLHFLDDVFFALCILMCII